MRHVFKTVIKFAKTVASKGYAAAMAEADADIKRDLRLHRIYHNQIGPGRNTHRIKPSKVYGRNARHGGLANAFQDAERKRARRRLERAVAKAQKTGGGVRSIPRHIIENAAR
jgi:hypothetical protein